MVGQTLTTRIKTAHGSAADLRFRRHQTLIRKRYTPPLLFEGLGWIHQNWIVCCVCVSLLHALCLGVLLFGFVMLLVSLFFSWAVHYPRGSLPVCLALHGPPDGKCLLLITHRWTERTHTEVCAHLCLFACDSIHLCHCPQ